jgi:hypothetical protein
LLTVRVKGVVDLILPGVHRGNLVHWHTKVLHLNPGEAEEPE